MTHEHRAVIEWERGGARFSDRRYSRGHRWRFDGGVTVAASASPHIVRAPYSVAEAVDPEEAFVASLASCHMLFFLSLAAEGGFVVDTYHDEAVGELAPDADGRVMMTTVTLRPLVRFGGDRQPSPAEVAALHHRAHDECFLARSLTTDVRCEPVPPP